MRKNIEVPTLGFPAAPEQGLPAPWAYRVCRSLVRLWILLFFRRIRLLHAEVMLASGAAILAVCRPPGFLNALVLIAAFDKEIHCLLSGSFVRGILRRWLARRLGTIIFEPSAGGWQRAVEACCNLLGRGKTIVVFAEERGATSDPLRDYSRTLAALALEAEARFSFELGLCIHPVHMFQPQAGARQGGLLIHVEAPLCASDYLPRAGGPAAAITLAPALETACRENAFRLRPEQLDRFLDELEGALRDDLEEAWACRQNWKQTAEGFELSAFVRARVLQMNYHSPGWLVGIADYLHSYREARRSLALRQAEVELAGDWIKYRWRRLLVWAESLVGLPLACYGLVNHLLVWVVIFWTGLLAKESERNPRLEWLLRGLIGLACYAGQTFLAARWLGKMGGLVYGVSLPLSGAYLWRYGRLLHRRARLLCVAAGLSARNGRVRRLRKNVIAELNASCRAYARRLGLPH